MKTVLWISRHTMTDEQFCSLERIAGEPVKLSCWKDTVEELESLADQIREADLIAAVLPLHLMARLLEMAGDKPVLCSCARREPTGRILTLEDGRQEAEYRYLHDGWEQIQELHVRIRKL
ncbi:MAG: hypothetical protein K6C12_11370 [Oscillospiraceae bacterium]|nr:hypothetical protein [Oscillospiraceae bacterium]